MDTIVFDIETKETFDEVGEYNPLKLSISLLGAYSFDRQEYRGFLEDELVEFWKWLENAELVVGFNSDHFDIPIVGKYWPQVKDIHSLDIMKEIAARTGHRVKLDSVAEATLGEKKTGHGLEAIKMFREGRIDDLKKYCLDDVRITKDIYEFGKQEGKVLITDFRLGVKEVEINFKPEIKKIEAVELSLGL